MTKYEFLYKLQQGLAPMSPTDRMERCAFYEELINDMTEDGYTEEEAAQKLGDPTVLAEAILREEPEAARGGAERRSWRWRDMVAELVQSGLGSLRASHSPKERFSCTLSPLGVSSLEVRWSSGSVEIFPEDREDILLTEERSPEAPPLFAETEDGVLRISQAQAGRLCREEKLLTVALPRSLAQLLEKCAVYTSSGDVNLRELRTDALNLQTQSGDGTMRDIRAMEARITTVSGDMDLELDADRCSVSTISGDADLRGRASESAEIQSVSGDLELELNAGRLSVQTVSGDFTVRGTADHFHGGVVSGDGDIRLDNCPDELSAEAVSGDMEIRLPEGSRFQTSFETKSGSLECSASAAGRGEGPLFRFKSISGDVTIQA